MVHFFPAIYISQNTLYTTQTMESSEGKLKYLNQDNASKVDIELFEEYKFSVDQLMELAGQSCAHAIYKVYELQEGRKVLICAGPGNNGGDGLVCSRHLKLLGYNPVIFYPKPVDKILFNNLVHQCKLFDIPFINSLPTQEKLQSDFFLIVDALFGFSFKPPVRPFFVPIMEILSKTNLPVASIDIPSGWHVEDGPLESQPFNISPEFLISLSAPKLCARFFKGKYHFLGGRFLPPKLQEKFQLNLPVYPECDQVVKL